MFCGVKSAPAVPEGKIVRGRPLLPSSIVNLLAGCPAAEANPEHCPLHQVRKLPVQEALDWAAGLSTDDKAFLLQYHRCCLVYSIEEQRAAREHRSPSRPQPVRKKVPSRRAQ